MKRRGKGKLPSRDDLQRKAAILSEEVEMRQVVLDNCFAILREYGIAVGCGFGLCDRLIQLCEYRKATREALQGVRR